MSHLRRISFVLHVKQESKLATHILRKAWWVHLRHLSCCTWICLDQPLTLALVETNMDLWLWMISLDIHGCSFLLTRVMCLQPSKHSSRAINTAYYYSNRLYYHPMMEKTPYELLNERKPNIVYFRVFSCKYYILKKRHKIEQVWEEIWWRFLAWLFHY